jgi:hypothetical protein
MNDPHYHLTPGVRQRILDLIHYGAFPETAAEAAGIPVKVFRRWLGYGEAKRPNPLYRDFLLAVRTAQAETRVLAEHEALHHRPLDWLKNGPGKETARMPGWTSPVKAATPNKKQGGMSLARTLELCQALLQALTPYPEAREAAAEALHKGGWLREDPDGTPAEAAPVVETVETPNDNPAPPAELAPDVPECPASPAPTPPVLPVMETKCFDAAPAWLPAGRPEVSVKACSTRGEPAVNPQPTHSEAPSRASGSGGLPREKTVKSGPAPWDPLDAGHWIVFSSS